MKLLRIVTSTVSLVLIKGQYRYLREHGIDVIVVTGPPPLSDKDIALLEGAPHRLMPHLVRPISVWNDVKALFELIKLIRREKPDVVHANTPKASLLGITAAWWCRVPHRIYTVTGLRFQTATGLFRRLLITMERITCRLSTKVIPEGDGVAKTLRAERITRKPLNKLHNGNINGLDLAHFDKKAIPMDLLNIAKSETGFTDKHFTFIFVGRIVKDKGICELLEAFSRLYQEDPDVRLVLVGDFEQKLDPLPEDVDQTIKTHKAIYCTGWQDDVRPWLAVADALAFPSYREGFPNVVMQAGAMELPCVVSDINGCNEIIIEGENGLIVPPHDAFALYHGMKRIMEDKVLYNHCKQNARPLIASRYKQEDVWQATLEMYQSLTSKLNK